MVEPSHRREAVGVLVEFGLSERTACRLVGVERSTQRYKAVAPKDGELRLLIKELAGRYRRFGYRRLHVKILKSGIVANHKAVQRIYQEEGLQVQRRRRKKIAYTRQPMQEATRPNEVWSMDFIWDRTVKGQPLKFYVVMDDFTKELLVLEPALSMASGDVIRHLQNAISWFGRPGRIRSDNGSEFTSRQFLRWGHEHGVDHHLIEPGRPMQNGLVESLNGKIRDEFLNEHWFLNLEDAKDQAEEFKHLYNTDREHSSLGRLTPTEFKQKLASTLSA